MAVITPASDSFPSMIPPADFPIDDETAAPGPVRRVRGSQNPAALMAVEVEEMQVLTGFLAAFARYIADRHNPDASSAVLRRYRAAIRFYGAV